MRTFMVVTWILGWIIFSPGALHAQTSREDAISLLRQGNKLHSKGDYKGALNKYRQAFKRYPSYKLEFNIASTLYVMGRLTEAAGYLDRFLLRASKIAPRKMVEKAQKRFEELRTRLARVMITCAIPGATIKVDGEPAGRTPQHRHIYLLPGKRALTVEKEGFPRFTHDLEVAAGEFKELAVDWVAKPVDAPPPPKKRRVKRSGAKRAKEVGAAAAKRRRTKSIWAYTTLGVGVAFALGAGALYTVGGLEGRAAYKDYAKETYPDLVAQYRGEVEAAETKLIVGHVLAGVALAATAVSIYHFLTRPAAEEPGGQQGRAAFSVAPAANGAMISVEGVF